MQDVIDRIKAAEENVKSIKRRARNEADLASVQAKRDGKAYLEEKNAEANRRADRMIRADEKSSGTFAAEKIRTATKEADEILKMADSRMNRVTEMIVEGIVDNI